MADLMGLESGIWWVWRARSSFASWVVLWCGGRRRTVGLEVFGVGSCWLFEVEAGSLVVA
ncbi:hypothetical protein KY290_022317 [Solanum tuberosum]|uniref:Uncharacterized protein n=1 Tax=Solanum tuberosum TaxID=4113 RepID=A0ABQ7V401_SOLTU|nr:hypothetical protein KY289_021437 [Solanum tuberosum]KAH0758824.1 hypothetical protein KY290_022317 [Solanum tuberosum]